MNQRNPTMKLIAATVVFTFFVTSLAITPNAFAATGVPAGEVSSIAAGMLRIPAELGQVTDTVMGDPKAPAFIHIQSAHGNYQAEKNIEKLLGFIEKNSKVRLMLLEGAADKLHPELFRIFPNHPDFNRKVTDKLMQEGYLTGSERFLIENDQRLTTNDQRKKSIVDSRQSMVEGMTGYGVEDLDSYKKDRNAFISVVKKEKAAEKFLGSLRATIDKRFSSKLNKDLLNLVRQDEAFGLGTVSFEGWLKTLGEGSKKHLKMDLSDAFYQDQYPFLIRYFRLQAIGSKIDQEKALKEMGSFLKELEKRKVSEDIINLFKQDIGGRREDGIKAGLTPSAIHQPSSVSEYSPLRRAFDNAFEKLPKDFSMTQWPNWTLYAQYIILMQEMEGKGLHEETVSLKDKIQTALAKTANENEYLAEARGLYLLRRLFSLALTRPEYEELTQTVKPSDIQVIQAIYETAMGFYSTAIDRENKMFANALKRMNLQKQDRAVIVTGGFHAEGLRKLAASQNCLYIQITPRIAEASKRDHEVYLKSILGSRDVETSQMSGVLGTVRAEVRMQMTDQKAAMSWRSEIRQLIRGLITLEPVFDQPDLFLAFSNSIFRDKTSLQPAYAQSRSEMRDLSRKDRKALEVLRNEVLRGGSQNRSNPLEGAEWLLSDLFEADGFWSIDQTERVKILNKLIEVCEKTKLLNGSDVYYALTILGSVFKKAFFWIASSDERSRILKGYAILLEEISRLKKYGADDKGVAFGIALKLLANADMFWQLSVNAWISLMKLEDQIFFEIIESPIHNDTDIVHDTKEIEAAYEHITAVIESWWFRNMPQENREIVVRKIVAFMGGVTSVRSFFDPAYVKAWAGGHSERTHSERHVLSKQEPSLIFLDADNFIWQGTRDLVARIYGEIYWRVKNGFSKDDPIRPDEKDLQDGIRIVYEGLHRSESEQMRTILEAALKERGSGSLERLTTSFAEFFDRRFKEKCPGEVKLITGVKRFFEEVHKKRAAGFSIQLVLLSNAAKSTLETLTQMFRIENEFAQIVGSPWTGSYRKADKIVDIAQLLPGAFVAMGGDSWADVEAAKEAGRRGVPIVSFAAPTGSTSKEKLIEHGADLIVNNLGEAEKIFAFFSGRSESRLGLELVGMGFFGSALMMPNIDQGARVTMKVRSEARVDPNDKFGKAGLFEDLDESPRNLRNRFQFLDEKIQREGFWKVDSQDRWDYVDLLAYGGLEFVRRSGFLSDKFKQQAETGFLIPTRSGQLPLFLSPKLTFSQVSRVLLAYLLDDVKQIPQVNQLPVSEGSPRILLVAPYEKQDLKIGSYLAPPFGIYRIANYFRLFGISVDIFDPNLSSTDELLQKVRDNQYDLIGSSTYDPTIANDVVLAKRMQEESPNSIFVVGGEAAPYSAKKLLGPGNPYHVLVRGLGEFPLLDLVRAYREKGSALLKDTETMKGIHGIVWPTDSGEIVESYPLMQLGNIDHRVVSLFFDTSIVPFETYWDKMENLFTVDRVEPDLDRIRTVRLITVSHCSMNCTFCSARMFFRDSYASPKTFLTGERHPVLALSADEVVRVLKNVLKFHPKTRTIFFNEDDFLIYPKRVSELTDLIKKEYVSGGLPQGKLRFIGLGRVDKVNPELLRKMRDIGFTQLNYGIEHFSDKVLVDMKKNVTSAKAIRGLDWTLDSGITPLINLIPFYPTATVPDVMETMDITVDFMRKGALMSYWPFIEAFRGATIMNMGYEVDEKLGILLPVDLELRAAALEAYRKKSATVEEIKQRHEISKKLPHAVDVMAFILAFYRAAKASPDRIEKLEALIKEKTEAMLVPVPKVQQPFSESDQKPENHVVTAADGTVIKPEADRRSEVRNASENPLDQNTNILSVLKIPQVRRYIYEDLALYWREIGRDTNILDPILDLMAQSPGQIAEVIKLVHRDYPQILQSPAPEIQSRLAASRRQQLQTMVGSMKNHIKGPVVLDVGAGNAVMAGEILRQIGGIETFYLSDTQFSGSETAADPRIRFLRQISSHTIELPKNSVDTIVLSMMLHHVARPDREQLLANLAKVLKPGGNIVVLEDTFPEGSDYLANHIPLTGEFLNLSIPDRFRVLGFLDFWGNRIVRNNAGIPFPFTYETMEVFESLFERRHLSMALGEFEIIPLKALMVFVNEKKPERSEMREPQRGVEKKQRPFFTNASLSVPLDEIPSGSSLVTGSTGFIGSQLTRLLAIQGEHPVIAPVLDRERDEMDKLWATIREPSVPRDTFRFVEAGDQLDLMHWGEHKPSEAELEKMFSNIAVIYHLAAQTASRPLKGQTYHDWAVNNIVTNVLMTKLLAAIARKTGKSLVYSSSLYAFALDSLFEKPVQEEITEQTEIPWRPQTQVFASALGEKMDQYIAAYMAGEETLSPIQFVENFVMDFQIPSRDGSQFTLREMFQAYQEYEAFKKKNGAAIARVKLEALGKRYPLDLMFGFYALTKVLPESNVLSLPSGHGAVLRFTNVYGPTMRADAPRVLLDKISAGEAVALSDHGRYFVSWKDIVQALRNAGERLRDPAHHFGNLLVHVTPGGEPLLLEDLYHELLKQVTDLTGIKPVMPPPNMFEDPPVLQMPKMSSKGLAELLGRNPSAIEEGLRDFAIEMLRPPPLSERLVTEMRGNTADREAFKHGVSDVMASGWFTGKFHVQNLEQKMAATFGVKHAIAVGSGTEALAVTLRSLGVGPGDEVITTAFSYIATANAIADAGAKPVFVDIDPVTYNLDPEKIKAAITSRTKAILPVYIFGQAANLAELTTIAKRHKLHLIGDMAQAVGATYQGESAATYGDAAIISLDPTKNIYAVGKGGVILTNRDDLAATAKSIRSHGSANAPNVHSRVGINATMQEIPAMSAVLTLAHLDEWTQKRQHLANLYNALLRDIPDITLPQTAEDRNHTYWQYVIRVPALLRSKFAEFLKQRRIENWEGYGPGIFYPIPMYAQKSMTDRGFGFPLGMGAFPVVEEYTPQFIALPIFPQMTDAQVRYIAKAVRDFFKPEHVSDDPARQDKESVRVRSESRADRKTKTPTQGDRSTLVIQVGDGELIVTSSDRNGHGKEPLKITSIPKDRGGEGVTQTIVEGILKALQKFSIPVAKLSKIVMRTSGTVDPETRFITDGFLVPNVQVYDLRRHVEALLSVRLQQEVPVLLLGDKEADQFGDAAGVSEESFKRLSGILNYADQQPAKEKDHPAASQRVFLYSWGGPVVENLVDAILTSRHELVGIAVPEVAWNKDFRDFLKARNIPIILISESFGQPGINRRIASDSKVAAEIAALGNKIRSFNADVGMVIQFSQVPDVWLDLAKKMTVNFHPSELPNYRGARPRHMQLFDKRKEFAVTWHQITTQIDQGPIMKQIPHIPIYPDHDRVIDLYWRFIEPSSRAAIQLLNDFGRDEAVAKPQQGSPVQTAWNKDVRPLQELDFASLTAVEIQRRIRIFFNFFPEVWAKVGSVPFVPDAAEPVPLKEEWESFLPGMLLKYENGYMWWRTPDGVVKVHPRFESDIFHMMPDAWKEYTLQSYRERLDREIKSHIAILPRSLDAPAVSLDHLGGAFLSELFQRNIREKRIIDTSERESINTDDGLVLLCVPARKTRYQVLPKLPNRRIVRVLRWEIQPQAAPWFDDHMLLFLLPDAKGDVDGGMATAEDVRDMLLFADRMTDFGIYFNGPKSGASLPERRHFQTARTMLPIERAPQKILETRDEVTVGLLDHYPISGFVFRSHNQDKLVDRFRLYQAYFDKNDISYNLFIRKIQNKEVPEFQVILVPRKSEYSKLMSNPPAFSEIGGVILTVDKEDYERSIRENNVARILSEVGYSFNDVEQFSLAISEGQKRSETRNLEGDVQGVLFEPRFLISDRDGVQHPLFSKRKRSSQEVWELLRSLKEPLEIEANFCGVDGVGSGLPEFPPKMTPNGSTQLSKITSMLMLASDLRGKMRFEAASNPDVIEYVAPQYGFSSSNPYTVKGKVPLTQEGRTPNGQADAPAYIFSNIFGITGIRVIYDSVPPMALAGGMESSNVFNAILFAAASMLSGDNWTSGDIFSEATRVENEVFGGFTGGQGTAVAFLGNGYHYRWLWGMKDASGKLFNPYSSFATSVAQKSLDFFERHIMIAQAGKQYANGKAVRSRSAALINTMWMDLLRADDPAARKLYDEMVVLAEKYSESMKGHKLQATVEVINRFVDIRDELCRLWMDRVLEGGREEWLGRMKDSDQELIATYEVSPAQQAEIQLLIRDLKEKKRERMQLGTKRSRRARDLQAEIDRMQGMLKDYAIKNLFLLQKRKMSFYSDTSKELIAEGRRWGIAVMPTGAGGTDSTLFALSPNGLSHLRKFFASQGMGALEESKVEAIVQGTGLLRGYMPFKVGRTPMQFRGFAALGLTPPLSPGSVIYNEITGRFRSVDQQGPRPSYRADWRSVLSRYPDQIAAAIWTKRLKWFDRGGFIPRTHENFNPATVNQDGIATGNGASVVCMVDERSVREKLQKIQAKVVEIFGQNRSIAVPEASFHVTIEGIQHGVNALLALNQLPVSAKTLKELGGGPINGILQGPFWDAEFGVVMVWKSKTKSDPLISLRGRVDQLLKKKPTQRPFHLTLLYPTQSEWTIGQIQEKMEALQKAFPTPIEISVELSNPEAVSYGDVAFIRLVREKISRAELRQTNDGNPIEGRHARSELRKEVGGKELLVKQNDPVVAISGLSAKIGTAVRVAANTVSPLLSVSPVYASEVASELFGGTIHYQQVAVVPVVFVRKWPMFSKIISRFAVASTERMVIDQRQGVPDAASVLPLVTFALYNPKVAVVLALIADASEVAAFEKELAVLSQNGALPQNFGVRAFTNGNEFVGAFAGFYNSAAPLGQPMALITDREDSVVTQKIGSRRHLLSVVGAQNPLKQTAATLLAADKLLNESIWSRGYHFVSVDKLGGLEALMAELANFTAAQAKVLASA